MLVHNIYNNWEPIISICEQSTVFNYRMHYCELYQWGNLSESQQSFLCFFVVIVVH